MSRGHSIYHYATKADYELVIADIAAQLEVKYTVDEYLVEPKFRVYQSPLDAHDFGLTKAPQYAGLTSFLVLMHDDALPFGYMERRQVPEKFGLIPSLMPVDYSWGFFRSSGFYRGEPWEAGMLDGWISTNSKHPDSVIIFNAFKKSFKKSIKKRFEYFKHSSVYVGPEAVNYFDNGGRLTQDLRQPREGDVKR